MSTLLSSDSIVYFFQCRFLSLTENKYITQLYPFCKQRPLWVFTKLLTFNRLNLACPLNFTNLKKLFLPKSAFKSNLVQAFDFNPPLSQMMEALTSEAKLNATINEGSSEMIQKLAKTSLPQRARGHIFDGIDISFIARDILKLPPAVIRASRHR